MTRTPFIPRYLLYSPRAWRVAPLVLGILANLLFWGGALTPFNAAKYPAFALFNTYVMVLGLLMAAYGLYLGAARTGRVKFRKPPMLWSEGVVLNAALVILGAAVSFTA